MQTGQSLKKKNLSIWLDCLADPSSWHYAHCTTYKLCTLHNASNYAHCISLSKLYIANCIFHIAICTLQITRCQFGTILSTNQSTCPFVEIAPQLKNQDYYFWDSLHKGNLASLSEQNVVFQVPSSPNLLQIVKLARKWKQFFNCKEKVNKHAMS